MQIPHNTHRAKDGAYMSRPTQQIGSFMHFFARAFGRAGVKELSGYVPQDESGVHYGTFGSYIHFRRLNVEENTYKVSYCYKAGRGGIAQGQFDVPKTVTVKVQAGIDPNEYLGDILTNRQPIEIDLA
mgnify:CR=1 FL=1